MRWLIQALLRDFLTDLTLVPGSKRQALIQLHPLECNRDVKQSRGRYRRAAADRLIIREGYLNFDL